MITYVNTVLVSNLAAGAVLTAAPAAAASKMAASADAGKFIFMNCDSQEVDPSGNSDSLYKVTATTNVIKIGIVTKNNIEHIAPDGTRTYLPIIKWSNEIKKDDIKSYKMTANSDHANAAEKVDIDFTNLDADVLDKFNDGGKRLIVRITYKDMPTRFRKWTESYEYVTKSGDTAITIGDNIAKLINKDYKRARVTAASDGAGKVTITAMDYDDDNSSETINLAGVVRFNVNVYYTDPDAAAFASRNKYFPTGVVITKTPGVQNPVDAKLVRDRESLSMGYEGILNRGEGTWPIIKPSIEAQLDKQYDGITLEFENMYRAADDIQRKTKQTLEIYGITGQLAGVDTTLTAFIG